VLSAEYLAGLLDGEGSLSLARRYRRDRSIEYSVRVAVYNCDRLVLEAVQESWGGHLASVGPRHPEWRVAHSLIWTNSAAAGVLRALAPHLRVKARHAAVLLRFQAHVNESARSRDPAGRLLPSTQREQRIRARFHAQLRSMNRRGNLVRSWGKSGANSSVRKARISDEYLAGFVDAEGSLMIAKFRATNPGKWYYRARASLDNVDGQVLREIQRTYGGILFRRAAGSQVGAWCTNWSGQGIGRSASCIRSCLTFASRGNRENSFYGLSNIEVRRAYAELEPGTAPFRIGLSR
jgi:hypothetical protein